MNVSCPSCNTVFRVDPAKVPEGGVRARCTVCRAIFRVAGEIMPEPPVTAVAPSRRAAAGPMAPGPTAPAPAYQTPPGAQHAAPVLPHDPGVPAPPVTPPVMPQPTPAAPAAPPQPAAPMRPAAPPVSRRPVMPPTSQAPPVAPTRPAAPAPRPSGAPINPFLSHDPKQKARRLARALVSDLVVYHPDKRQEGLRNGTLKELFDDEIKKSWEEYTEQIGPDVSDAASYFSDALNEILSDGRTIF